MKKERLLMSVICCLVITLTLGACKKMEMVRNGSKVDFHYTLTVDGNKVESSFGKEPLNYEHGKGGIIQGMQEAMEGLKAGDKKTVTIPPEKAYGVRNEKAVVTIAKTSIKDADKLKTGSMISFMQGEQRYQALVGEVTADSVTLDYNHPMAGKTLTFDIEVVKVENKK
jgi:FKBP-type peptidyl-prolyl cis-trans isomerase 2